MGKEQMKTNQLSLIDEQDQSLDRFEGVLDRIVWQGNGAMIGRVNGKGVKGDMIKPELGLTYELWGKWIDSQYGPTFKFKRYLTKLPSTRRAVRMYLENFPWIGKAISAALLEKFGDKTLEVLKHYPELACEVRGITLGRAAEISERLKQSEQIESLEIQINTMFEDTFIPKNTIKSITEHYVAKHGVSHALDYIRANPYELTKFKLVSFPRADMVAQRIGIEVEDPERIKAAIQYFLEEKANLGDTRVEQGDFYTGVSNLLEIRPVCVAEITRKLCEDESDKSWLITYESGDEFFVALRKYYTKEAYILSKLLITAADFESLKIDQDRLDSMLSGVTSLAGDQQDALRKFAKSKVLILTGSPGTGKTYTVNLMRELARRSTLMLAPTGKAAQRLEESTGGKAAQTIHRALDPVIIEKGERDALSFSFRRNRLNQFTDELIVIDECSMISVDLFASLMEAIDDETSQVVLVGDPDQLPPVGAGNVFSDLIESGRFEVAKLHEIKRQERGKIVEVCDDIRRAMEPEIKNEATDDLVMIRQRDNVKMVNEIVSLFSNERMNGISTKIGLGRALDPIYDIQVISPAREKSEVSCKDLNIEIKKKLNPGTGNNPEKIDIRDKVIQTRNDYKLGIMNGDIGQVVWMDEKNYHVEFQNPNRLVIIDSYKHHLQLAYAITVHKMQGSEAPVIVFPISKSFGPFLMYRNLVYTAISRARKLCVLVGDVTELQKAIWRDRPNRRETNLLHFI